MNKTGLPAATVLVKLKRVVVDGAKGANAVVKEDRSELIEQAYLKLKGGMEIDEVIRLYSSKAFSDPRKYVEYQLSDLQDELRQKLEVLEENSFTEPVYLMIL